MAGYDYNAHLQRYSSVARQSAKVILPFLREIFPFQSVVDVGCGKGTWLAVAEEEGIAEFLGVDGQWIDRSMLEIPAAKLEVTDLERPLDLKRRFDLAISLEVASDISAEHAALFVDSLVRHSDTILFSSGVRTQTHRPHKNRQWQSYWANKFRERGFATFDIIRPCFWTDARVGAHYRQNCLVFARDKAAETITENLAKTKLSLAFPLDVVHPEIAPVPPPRHSLRSLIAKAVRRIRGR